MELENFMLPMETSTRESSGMMSEVVRGSINIFQQGRSMMVAGKTT